MGGAPTVLADHLGNGRKLVQTKEWRKRVVTLLERAGMERLAIQEEASQCATAAAPLRPRPH